MSDTNVIVFEGRLTKEPELKTTKTGLSVATFSLASNYYYNEQQETTFLDVEVWGKQAENCCKYLVKGQKARAVGRLKQSSWEYQGRTYNKFLISAQSIDFGAKPKGRSDNDEEYVAQPLEKDDYDIPY